MGARPGADGLSAVHTHMTNTMNTPIEALELYHPMRVRSYRVRRGSGGDGYYRGGDGVVRDTEFLAPAVVTVLADRRRSAPYGLQGGADATPGETVLLKHGVEEVHLPPKVTLDVAPGDVLSIRTPRRRRLGQARPNPFALSLSKGPLLHASFRRVPGSRGADARGAHEVGHAWGLGHARNRTAIVVETAIVEATPPYLPTRNDAVGVMAVYQSR